MVKKEVMVKGLCGVFKSNGYDHDITEIWGSRDIFGSTRIVSVRDHWSKVLHVYDQ